MAYYQAHLLLLAGYSQFFVSGLVLPQPAFDSDDEDDFDVEVDEMAIFTQDESPEAEPMAVDEPCAKFAATEEDADEDEAEVEDAEEALTPITPAGPAPEQRRRKRLSAVSESHVRTMSRWLRDSAASLGDRQRQLSGPDSPPQQQQREKHETKRFCAANRRPRLPALQTSLNFVPPRLSVA
ncbi:hypothetical protein BKCO1_5000042 [Neofusicoccum parvum]|uniref:Uncharacterized protein n=1 Tax=Neofusicoccum parvum TaxID=310453 RepID=A0ACB5SEF9_9PEZI|nr:hypothetical protein BKCO1_5000042 [Neofusicoccum parvum]